MEELINQERDDTLSKEALAEIQSKEVKKLVEIPKNVTSRELSFDLENTDLKPGEKIIILLPSDLKGSVKDVIIGHNKREEYWNLKAGQTRKDYDPAGAYSRVRIWDEGQKKYFDWQDPKGYDPIKYAERRYDIEEENLHDWKAIADISPRMIEITSMGNDPDLSVVTLYFVNLITHPEISEDTEFDERIYTPGTEFIDLKNGSRDIPNYGGGKNQQGYPKAIPLGRKNAYEQYELTEQLEEDGEKIDLQGNLHIKLQPGKKILSLELSIGDTWFNYLNSGQYKLGWAKLFAKIKKQNGETDEFMKNVNIPPQGVLSGGPTDPDYVTQAGDEIIVSSQNTSYLMGWRIAYEPVGCAEERAKIGSVLNNNEQNLSLEATTEGAGTQGGKWHIDRKTNERYFVKEYNGNIDRCASEYISSQIYKELGIFTSEVQLYQGKAISKEMKGMTNYINVGSRHDLNKVRDFFKNTDINSGFVIDAWLANWDVLGLDFDNVLKSADGKIARIDHGGTLFFRGMGDSKPSFASEVVSEINTMRNPEKAREAGLIFQDVTDEEIENQVQKIKAVMSDAKIRQIVSSSGISNAEEVINALLKRRDYLVNQFCNKQN